MTVYYKLQITKISDLVRTLCTITRTDTEIWSEIQPVKVLHCVNGDGPKFGQNGCGTHSSQILTKILVTPYVAVLKRCRAKLKINSVSVRVNKASCIYFVQLETLIKYCSSC